MNIHLRDNSYVSKKLRNLNFYTVTRIYRLVIEKTFSMLGKPIKPIEILFLCAFNYMNLKFLSGAENGKTCFKLQITNIYVTLLHKMVLSIKRYNFVTFALKRNITPITSFKIILCVS